VKRQTLAAGVLDRAISTVLQATVDRNR